MDTAVARLVARLSRSGDRTPLGPGGRGIALAYACAALFMAPMLLLVPYPEDTKDFVPFVVWSVEFSVLAISGSLWLRAARLRAHELALGMLGMQVAGGVLVAVGFSGSTEAVYMMLNGALAGAVLPRRWVLGLMPAFCAIAIVAPMLHVIPPRDPTGEGVTVVSALIPMMLGSMAAAQYMRELVSRVRRLADLDALTSLPNRRALHEYMTQLFAHGPDAPTSAFDYVQMDLDHFKKINDTYGHVSGDEVLKATADAIVATEPMFCARIGGEEFVVLFEPDRTDASCESILTALVLKLQSKFGPVSASFGVAEFPGDARSIEQLVLRSDTALYAAKRNGRARVERAGSIAHEHEDAGRDAA